MVHLIATHVPGMSFGTSVCDRHIVNHPRYFACNGTITILEQIDTQLGRVAVVVTDPDELSLSNTVGVVVDLRDNGGRVLHKRGITTKQLAKLALQIYGRTSTLTMSVSVHDVQAGSAKPRLSKPAIERSVLRRAKVAVVAS